MRETRPVNKEDLDYMMKAYTVVSKSKDKAKKETIWVLEYYGSRTYLTKNWVTGKYTAITIPG